MDDQPGRSERRSTIPGALIHNDATPDVAGLCFCPGILRLLRHEPGTNTALLNLSTKLKSPA